MLRTLCLALLSSVSATSTMNNRTYTLANPLAAGFDAGALFRGESFEMYGNWQTTTYAEVDWHADPVPMPADIVARFDGKVMAITGYEVNIVRNVSGVEELVPTWQLYNHHYSGFMHGKKLREVPYPEGVAPVIGSHGSALPYYEHLEASRGFPSLQAFSEGNGNEHRNSFKGYSKEFAQLIESPTTFTNNAMIINTNKKLTDDTSPGPIGGPVPRMSLAPKVVDGKGADYQAVLECPCTSRKPKILDGYTSRQSGACAAAASVKSAAECVHASVAAGIRRACGRHETCVGEVPFTTAAFVKSATLPGGCFATAGTDGVWSLQYNNATGAQSACGAGAAAAAALTGGSAAGSVGLRLSLDAASKTATFTLSCASNGSWFGIGLNATMMEDLPYALIVDGAGRVTERRMGMHSAGTALPPSPGLKLVSSTLAAGVRVVVLARSIKADAQHFDMSAVAAGSLPFISAVGKTAELSYHKQRTSGSIALAKVGSSACLCRDPTSNTGSIDGIRFNPKVCAPFPRSDLLTTHNAICNLTRYEGGLYCCHDKTLLLDEDQPRPTKMDTWRMKYRFYFEDYTAQKVKSVNSFRVWWATEAMNNEYDVPKSKANCLDPTTPAEDCVHTIRSQFQGRDLLSLGAGCMASSDPAACANVSLIESEYGGNFRLTYAAFHCHAPACMSGELWNRDTGELICRNDALYGTGSGALNETAYVVGIPPCVWGTAAEGLRPPPVLHLDSNLTTIKRTNNTNGHWGVMSLWQARGAYLAP